MAWTGQVRRVTLRHEPVGPTDSGFIGSHAAQCAALIAPYEGLLLHNSSRFVTHSAAHAVYVFEMGAGKQ